MNELAHPGPGMHHGHGWRPMGRRHRWLEPFVLVLIAQGCGHGYALSLRLHAMGVAPAGLDVGELYRTLRDLEGSGFVRSAWTSPEDRPRRREYALTELGTARLSEWAGVMRERSRLVGDFLALFEAPGCGTTEAPEAGRNG